MKRNVILQWLGYNWILNFPSLYWTHWISLVTLRVFNVIYWYLQCTSPSALVLRGGGLGQERRRDNLIKCKYNTFHYNFPSQLLRISFVLVFIFAAVSPGRVVWRYNIYKLRSVAILSYELWVLSIMIQSLTSII